MSNVLEYILKIKDLAQGPMMKFGEKVHQTFKRIEEDEKKLMQTNRYYGKSFDTIGASIDRLRAKARSTVIISTQDIANVRAMNSEIARLERLQNRLATMNGSRLKSWGRDAMNHIPGAGLLMNPIVAAGAGLAAMANAGMTQQQHRVKYQTLTGSESAGNALMGNLQNMAAKSPYRQDDVFESGTVLKGFGLSDNDTVSIMKMLGDVAMGSGNKLKELALVMGKVNTTGYLQGDELNSLIEKGFNPLNVIAQKTGKSYAELKKAMEKGAISSAMVTDALHSVTSEGGIFYNMTEKLSETFGGKLSTFLDNFSITLSKLGEVVLPFLSVGLEWLNTGLSILVDNMDILAPALMAVGAAWVYMNLGQVGYMIGRVVMQVKALNLAFLTSPFGLVVAGIMLVVGALMYLKKRFGTLENAWVHVKDIFLSVWGAIKIAFDQYVDNIITGVQYLYYKVAGFFDRMAQKAWNLGEAIVKAAKFDFEGASEAWNREEISSYDKYASELYNKWKDNTYGRLKATAGHLEKIKITWNDTAKSSAEGGVWEDAKSQSLGGASVIGAKGIKNTADSITGGGARNIYITLGKFQDNLNVYVQGIKEGADRAQEQMEDMLLRVLNSAGTAQ